MRERNPHLTPFLDVISEDRKRSAGNGEYPPKQDLRTYEEIHPLLHQPFKPRNLNPARWGRTASADDLRRVAEDLLTENDDTAISNYLRVFHDRPFPLHPERLIALTQHDHRFIPYFALSALENVSHPAVREFVFNSVQRGFKIGRVIGLLGVNFHDEDWHFITGLAPRIVQDDEEFHSLGFSVRHIFRLHPSEDAIPILLALYEDGRCSYCREDNVECLVELGRVPDWMYKECLYDSNTDLREASQDGFAK
jgi:hypothetical protein